MTSGYQKYLNGEVPDRLGRREQVARNRQDLLEAAQRVFVRDGYAGTTIDAVAEDAGFSKGVVYSQFGSKADLFLALVEQRIETRAAAHDAIAVAGGDTIQALAQRIAADEAAAPGWAEVLVEFRSTALRDPQVNRRYAQAHARTVERLAAVLASVQPAAGSEPLLDARTTAQVILALASGLALERAVDERAPRAEDLLEFIMRVVGESDGKAAPTGGGPP